MPKSRYKILVVEDNQTMREGIVRVMEKLGHEVTECSDGETAAREYQKSDFHLMVSDYKLPGITGLELLEKIKKNKPETEFLVITAYGSIELAVEAMQKGAADFITKPFSPEELTLKVNLILEKINQRAELQRVSEENQYLRNQIEDQFNFGEIIGQSPAMQTVFKTIEKVAKGDSSVIIYGESGTGKELVAHAIHKSSPRKSHTFVRVNCGALAEGVLESELFGHEKGAFTGAIKQKKGRFELAHGGSIFLDEIGDIPLGTQVKLLRVLQEKEFERVGGEETLSVDSRIIAATNKDLEQEIKQGNFREDLYYRLHIIPIYLPPLRERKEDIPPLTAYFIEKISKSLRIPELKINSSAIEKLCSYNWPGNIRELENVLERAAVLCEQGQIEPADLPLFSIKGTKHPQISEADLKLTQTLEVTEKRLLSEAMDKAHGVKTEAARLLGIKTSALYYKLEKYGLI